MPRSSTTPFGAEPVDATETGAPGPVQVLEFGDQAVEYVRRTLGVALAYDSDTLPVLDHYLRQVGAGPDAPRGPSQPELLAADLVAATAGAYFGEVVRRRLGGSWHLPSPDPGTWRLSLPSGLWFFPVAMAMAAIRGPDTSLDARDEDDDEDQDQDARPSFRDDDADGDEGVEVTGDWDASLQAPPYLRPHVERVLHGMADVSEDEYFSLCCRLDTLEHVQAVLAALASARRNQPDPDTLD
jgi:hypothetical protein